MLHLSGQVKDVRRRKWSASILYLNYRSSYDITNKPVGTFPKNTDVVITGAKILATITGIVQHKMGKHVPRSSKLITVSDQKYDGEVTQ